MIVRCDFNSERYPKVCPGDRMLSRRVLGYSVLDGLAATLGHSAWGVEEQAMRAPGIYHGCAR
jgi:hypothetical protein